MHGSLDSSTMKRARAKAPPMVLHFALPGFEVARSPARPRDTIARFVEREQWDFKLPTICVLNGAPVMRSEWRKVRIRTNDKLTFVSRPHGGGSGGSAKTFGLIAMIALAVIAPWAGGLLAASMGLVGTTATLVGGLIGAGIAIGGSLLINALLAPNAGGTSNNIAATDQIQQIYSIGASGNVASPLSPIPVQYGKWKDYPPYAATPWSEYIGNDQYLNLLLCPGCGKYDVANLYIDDTVLWDKTTGFNSAFTDVQMEVYDPGASVTLFPLNVTSASAVSGQQLIDPTGDVNSGWIGGYVANASGTQANALAIDLVFPGGVFTVNGSSGAIGSASAPVEVQIQPVNDAGAPIGGWTGIFAQTFTYATRSPQRTTLKTDPLTPGRYQVRVRRTDAPISGSGGTNDVVWAGLRAFINGPSSFAGVTTVAIRIKATSQVSQSSAKKFGVLRTRILPVWNGSAWVEQATRNPLWALYDAATNTDYGAKRPVAKVDFQSIVNLATLCDTRGDTFDYVFSSAVVVPQAFDTILKACRARHRWAGDMISVVRDQFNAVPQMLLTDRETVRGSLSLDWTFNSDDQADSVMIEYVDEDTWGPASVQYPPNGGGFTSTIPATIRIPGVVNRAQAYREAAFWYLQAYYRRTNITLDTEHDGRLLSFGSAIRVQTELPQTWGATGVVAAISGATLTLVPAPSWADSGTHYIAIRTKTGGQFGPVICMQGSDASHAVLDATDLAAVQAAQSTTISAALARAAGAEDPSFDFGVAASTAKNCVVISGRPNGDRVTLSLFVDDVRVHSDDLGSVPVGPTPSPLTDTPAPIVAGLTAVFRQGTAEPILEASWWPASGAQYYEAQVSYDGGARWILAYQGSGNSFSVVVDNAALTVRVAGIGTRHGAWSSVDVDPPTISIDKIYLAPDVRATLDTVQPAFDAAMESVKALNADLPNPTSLLTGLIDRSLKDRINELAEAAVANILRTAQIENTLRSAGIDINPDLGTVKIWALDQFKDGFNSYQSTVGATFDAVNSQIALRATVTQLADTAAALAAGFDPAYRWEFNGTSEGWTASGYTVTNNVGSITLAATGSAPYIESPAISLDAALNQILQMKVRRTAGAGFIVMKWGASFVHSRTLDVPASPTAWNTIVDLITDDPNWTGTLTAVRFYLGTTAGDTFEIDYVAFGQSQFQQLVLGGLDSRVTTAEVDISGLNAAVALKANLTTVAAQGATLSSVSADLAAADAAIALKASQADLTALGSDLTTVSNTLSAVEGSVSTVIDSSRENQHEKDVSDAAIIALLNGQQTQDNVDRQVASASQTLSAKVDSETSARAAADLVLAVQIGSNSADITSEQTARIDGDSALASSVSTLSTTVGGHTASLTTIGSSVDGFKVEYGVIGSIDGVTGGFIMSGIRSLDGSVSYAVEIEGDLIVDGSITSAALATNSVTAAKIAADAITAAKIAAGAITATKLDASVFTAVNANITNLTATNINSNYAIYNKIAGITSAYSAAMSYVGQGAASTQTATYVVCSFTYTTVSGNLLVWPSYVFGTGQQGFPGTGNTNGALAGASPSLITKLVIKNHSTGAVLQTIQIGATVGSPVVSSGLSGSAAVALTVPAGTVIDVQIVANLSVYANIFSGQVLWVNWVYAAASVVFLEPQGI